MLYQFRAPLFRKWNFKSIHAGLKNNPGLAQHFKDCHSIREKILGTLREAYTKQCGGVRRDIQSDKVVDFRADTLIRLLEEYMPMLETLTVLVNESLGGLLQGLETVWTSVLTDSWETKALSGNLQHEKVQVYFLYAQAIYSQAAMSHREHRSEIVTEEEKELRGGGDNISVLKGLISELKRSAGVWDYLYAVDSKCYPVQCKILTPELFRNIPQALSLMALANAQEFMVQVAVVTKKSNKLVVKLAEGVSVFLKEAMHMAKKGLGTEVTLSHDLLVYLDCRSKLYHGIALKYQSKVKLEEDLFGERVAVLAAAHEVLTTVEISPPEGKRKTLSPTLTILRNSVSDQLRAVEALLREARTDNDEIYHYKVPDVSKCSSVDHVKFIKSTEFMPLEAQVLLITGNEMEKLCLETDPTRAIKE